MVADSFSLASTPFPQPFLRSSSSGQVITYDDPDSLSLKAQFALEAGLHGVNVWDMHGDTSNWVLMDALRGGLGL